MRNYIPTVICVLLSVFGYSQADRLQVVASASMIADIAQNIIGDRHDIQMIVPIGGDPHLHEPTPRDARLVGGADLILINGLTFEGWITELIDNSGTSGETIIVTDGIDVLTSQTYTNSSDPHAWMDASNASIYAENIYKAISHLDPDNDRIYADNLKSYQDKVAALDREIANLIRTIPEQKRILVTSHDAFQYYGRRYGIRLEAIMGISTEAEAQTSDIRRVNKVIRESGIAAIFIESTINPKMIQQLATDNKIRIGGKLYADSLGGKDSPASTLIDMLRYNTKTIVNALKSTEEFTADKGSSKNLKVIGFMSILLLVTSVFFYKKINS